MKIINLVISNRAWGPISCCKQKQAIKNCNGIYLGYGNGIVSRNKIEDLEKVVMH